MRRQTLLALAALFVGTGLFIFLAPMAFYKTTPGVEMMGPFNLHFIRDAGLAYLASGLALGWGSWRRDRSLAIAGALWPALHALFHVQVWIARGIPLDFVALVNLVGIQLPAWLALFLAMRLTEEA